jgi:hypothetical protein
MRQESSTGPLTPEARPDHAGVLYRLLRERRSRRFARGLDLKGGPLTYRSVEAPTPLSEEERARLAFAACGVTGWALNDMGLGPGQGGTMMAGLTGRTVPSIDALQAVALVVSSDDGTWLFRRGADLSPAEVRELIHLAADEEYVEIWRRQAVRLSETRTSPPMLPPHNIPLNLWNAHAPGTTYFLPIADITLPMINVLLELLDERNALFPVDERASFAPAGVARFARSRGGHLDDSGPGSAPIRDLEMLLAEMIAVEAGMMLQNLGLAAEALGLGGYPNYAGPDVEWLEALGFRAETMPLSRYIGTGRLMRSYMRLRGLEQTMRVPVGLELVTGDVLLRSCRPPYFTSMRAAVEQVVERKLGTDGIYRAQALTNSGWREPAAVTAGIPGVSSAAFEATVAYCEYVFGRYGRFPAHLPAFRTHIGFQASHLDEAFYDRFYASGALSERHRHR